MHIPLSRSRVEGNAIRRSRTICHSSILHCREYRAQLKLRLTSVLCRIKIFCHSILVGHARLGIFQLQAVPILTRLTEIRECARHTRELICISAHTVRKRPQITCTPSIKCSISLFGRRTGRNKSKRNTTNNDRQKSPTKELKRLSRNVFFVLDLLALKKVKTKNHAGNGKNHARLEKKSHAHFSLKKRVENRNAVANKRGGGNQKHQIRNPLGEARFHARVIFTKPSKPQTKRQRIKRSGHKQCRHGVMHRVRRHH